MVSAPVGSPSWMRTVHATAPNSTHHPPPNTRPRICPVLTHTGTSHSQKACSPCPSSPSSPPLESSSAGSSSECSHDRNHRHHASDPAHERYPLGWLHRTGY